MATPLPAPGRARSTPPDAAEVLLLSRGLVSAVAPATGLSVVQGELIKAVCTAMTGYPADLAADPVTPDDLGRGLAARGLEFRTRIVQLMVLCALVLRPLPPEVARRVGEFAAELGVEEGMLDVARELAEGSLGLASLDFERNGYTAAWSSAAADALHTSSALTSAWDAAADDPDLARRWAALEALDPGTLGKRVTEFYRARGFVYPGLPGSAPPLLAQHDWVHVVADYGTTVESELEVFAFIARANEDMHAFSLLAMVVSLFETGYLQQGAGLFLASPGHLAETGMATRVADAMRRGAQCQGSIDFLGLDWFELADLPVDAARAHFAVPPKSDEALAVGSVGPWEAGGISPFQVKAGAALAEADHRPYQSYGARVLPGS